MSASDMPACKQQLMSVCRASTAGKRALAPAAPLKREQQKRVVGNDAYFDGR
jgi:hypothetical protein